MDWSGDNSSFITSAHKFTHKIFNIVELGTKAVEVGALEVKIELVLMRYFKLMEEKLLL